MSPGKEKTDFEKKIRELEEKIKRLEEEQGKEGEAEGVAESILEGLGGLLPGLGGLVRSLTKSEAFRERLQAIDEEIEEKFRTEPRKRVEVDVRVGRRPAVHSIPRRPPAARKPPVKKRKAPPEVKPEAIDSRDFPVDIFDEGDHMRVIAEMPGLERKDVRLHLEGDRLTISAEREKRKYHQVVSLPGRVTKVQEMTYRQGILEILVEKG